MDHVNVIKLHVNVIKLHVRIVITSLRVYLVISYPKTKSKG